MTEPCVGFLGFGKAAVAFAEDLHAAGVKKISVYDKNWNLEPYSHGIRQHIEKLSARLAYSPMELAGQAGIVLSMVTPASAEEAFLSIAPYLPIHSLYVDLNSCSPMTKQRCCDHLRAHNSAAHYLDGCILGAVSETRLKTPILLCGSNAGPAKDFLTKYGANIEIIDGTPGDASAVKMIRSVFMKGIEVLFIEALHGARAYNIQDQLLKTIRDTFQTLSFDQLVNMLVTTHAIHGKRRQGEMQEVIETLRAKSVDASMSMSTLEKFKWSSDLGLAEFFANKVPENYSAVVEAIYQKSRIAE